MTTSVGESDAGLLHDHVVVANAHIGWIYWNATAPPPSTVNGDRADEKWPYHKATAPPISAVNSDESEGESDESVRPATPQCESAENDMDGGGSVAYVVGLWLLLLAIIVVDSKFVHARVVSTAHSWINWLLRVSADLLVFLAFIAFYALVAYKAIYWILMPAVRYIVAMVYFVFKAVLGDYGCHLLGLAVRFVLRNVLGPIAAVLVNALILAVMDKILCGGRCVCTPLGWLFAVMISSISWITALHKFGFVNVI